MTLTSSAIYHISDMKIKSFVINVDISALAQPALCTRGFRQKRRASYQGVAPNNLKHTFPKSSPILKTEDWGISCPESPAGYLMSFNPRPCAVFAMELSWRFRAVFAHCGFDAGLFSAQAMEMWSGRSGDEFGFRLRYMCHGSSFGEDGSGTALTRVGFSRSISHCTGLFKMYSRILFNDSSFRMMCS